MANDYTLNVFWRSRVAGTNGVHTIFYSDRALAEGAARAIVRLDTTVHATLTYEPTGKDLFDEPGEAYKARADAAAGGI